MRACMCFHINACAQRGMAWGRGVRGEGLGGGGRGAEQVEKGKEGAGASEKWRIATVNSTTQTLKISGKGTLVLLDITFSSCRIVLGSERQQIFAPTLPHCSVLTCYL